MTVWAKNPFFTFVAGANGELSAGTLYAAQSRKRDDDGGRARLEWVNLGHATDGEIRAAIDAGIEFGRIFDSVVVRLLIGTGRCCPIRSPKRGCGRQ